jgi:hypothetical protein
MRVPLRGLRDGDRFAARLSGAGQDAVEA